MQWQTHRERTQQTLESGLEHRPVSFRKPKVLSSHPLPFFQDFFSCSAPYSHLIGLMAGAAGASSQWGIGSTQLKTRHGMGPRGGNEEWRRWPLTPALAPSGDPV